MIKFQQSDAGRSLSRRPKQRMDCVVRAYALVTCKTYDEAYDTFAVAGRKSGSGTAKKVWKGVLERENFVRRSFQPVPGQKRVTMEQFVEMYPEGRHIVQCAGHLVACINGIIFDDSMPRKDACVYASWSRA